MKKLVKSLIGLVGLVGLNNASAANLSTYDLDYHWNFAEKNVLQLLLKIKK